MNTMMMEKFNSLEVWDIQPINLRKFNGPLSLEDPPELKRPNVNDSQENKETLDANENIDDYLSGLYR